MMTDTPESVTLVPINRIEVLNSRDRSMKVFEEIVENIRSIGLKKPITVTERGGADGAPAYLLVCGEGRLNDLSTVKPLYPGVFPQPEADDSDAPYPKALLNLTLGFDLETFQIPPRGVDAVQKGPRRHDDHPQVQADRVLNPGDRIDRTVVCDQARPRGGGVSVARWQFAGAALKELGQDSAPCRIAKDFETYTYNHRINRLSTVQEHYMLRRAIDKGVSKERLVRAFNINLSAINSRINLLHGICPKAVELLQDHQFTPDVTRHLRKMKAARQIEAVELMIAANSITAAHAEALLKVTPPEQRTDYKPPQPEQPKGDPLEQIVKFEYEMSQVQEKYKHAEENYGSELLNLVVAKGYLKKLMEN